MIFARNAKRVYRGVIVPDGMNVYPCGSCRDSSHAEGSGLRTACSTPQRHVGRIKLILGADLMPAIPFEISSIQQRGLVRHAFSAPVQAVATYVANATSAMSCSLEQECSDVPALS